MVWESDTDGILESAANMDDLLNSTLGGTPEDNYTSGISAAAGVIKTDYSKLYAFQNVISHSMEEVLKSCSRKFQIKKLEAASEAGSPRTNNVTFAFGHAVGAGVAVYDQTKDLGQAILATFLAWDIDLFAEDRGVKASESFSGRARTDPKKSFAFAVYAVQKYATWYAENGMDWYDVVDLEATLVVDLQTGDLGGEYTSGGPYGDSFSVATPSMHYTGHADEFLRHRMSNRLRVKENKTTNAAVIHPAKYQNSNQATSYSIIAGEFGEVDYDVLYTIYSSTEQRWISFEFTKHELTRAEWVKTELFQAEDIQRYSEANFFPKNGGSCHDFGRECEYFGSCDLNLDAQFGMRFSELPVATVAKLNEIEPFKYVVSRDQIVASLRASMAKKKEG